jgi:hypothetical protein
MSESDVSKAPRSKVYTEPTSGKDGLKRTMKSSHERNKQGLPRSRRNKTKKFDANIEKRGNATNRKKVIAHGEAATRVQHRTFDVYCTGKRGGCQACH